MTLDESISVIPYQPRWVDLFHQERQRLQMLFVEIQHIGSTTVPGLAAKPIIDMMVRVQQTLTQLKVAGLEALGYEYLGEAGVPGRLYFRKREPHAYNIHLVQRPEIWTNNLLLRDYLRSHPAQAREVNYTRVISKVHSTTSVLTVIQ